ncbi:MAG: energy-coupling factor transporter ATPase [Firmicutes bacterium]|nr:energy-coupling factor transporter ATPase [Bacillota bacterium]MCL1953659.1 energy-coupling factor transporter ATPase [Bacillota bacterium]
MIEFNNVSFAYLGAVTPVLYNLSLSIEEGSFVALCGHNGSGKSTIARLCNGLLMPDKGQVLVQGNSTLDKRKLFEIRKTVGLVFQNPDNQTVATIVEDDVAFGPENIGIPRAEIRERVDWALQVVGMTEYAKGTHTRLSGGQKQRVAIASILALKPRVIVLDESTSMLDPKGRDEVLKVVQQLNREHGMTVIMITHFMEEAHLADRIVVLNKGKIVLDGGKEIFDYKDILVDAGLELPPYANIASSLGLTGINDEKNLVDKLSSSLKAQNSNQYVVKKNSQHYISNETTDTLKPVIVAAKDLTYTYSPKSSFAKVALDSIDISINEGDFLGIVGHTGSGKTTFVGHLNALIKMQYGQLVVCGLDLSSKFDFKSLRSQVGMVFQYPEYQLFDETVAKDIAFGPKNIKLEQKEIEQRVKESIHLVGLDFDTIANKSPFELSGGQKRRVALAGVIAMRPKILVLDEPTAGLDPKGKTEILDLIVNIKHYCQTVIMISHNMDEVAKYCNRVALFSSSKLLQVSSPKELFKQTQLLQSLRLDIPSSIRIASKLIEMGIDLPIDILSVEQLIEQLKLI